MLALMLLAPAPMTSDADRFAADLFASPTATAVLQARCPEAQVRAVQGGSGSRRIPAELRELLQLRPGETIRHRRVKLMCGERVFSEADNWYVPERLPEAIAARLETSDIPFGRAVEPLGVSRGLIDSKMLGSGRKLPERFLLVQALVRLGNGQPAAVVVERYRKAVLTPIR